MVVTVHLHTILQRQSAEGSIRQVLLQMEEDSKLEDVLQELEIELKIENLILVVNGRVAELNQVIQDGDIVNLMPAISGG